jgi:hypothetical protein
LPVSQVGPSGLYWKKRWYMPLRYISPAGVTESNY